MATDLLGAEADRGERIFNFVGNASSYFFPRRLLLCTEKFCRIFKDNDITLMLTAHAFGGSGHLEQSDCGKEIHRAAESFIGGLRGAGDFYFAGGRAHSMAALDETVEDVGDLR